MTEVKGLKKLAKKLKKDDHAESDLQMRIMGIIMKEVLDDVPILRAQVYHNAARKASVRITQELIAGVII